jgi:hypothetical protein
MPIPTTISPFLAGNHPIFRGFLANKKVLGGGKKAHFTRENGQNHPFLLPFPPLP